MSTNIDAQKGRGRPEKRWIQYVEKDMRAKGVNADLICDDICKCKQVVVNDFRPGHQDDDDTAGILVDR